MRDGQGATDAAMVAAVLRAVREAGPDGIEAGDLAAKIGVSPSQLIAFLLAYKHDLADITVARGDSLYMLGLTYTGPYALDDVVLRLKPDGSLVYRDDVTGVGWTARTPEEVAEMAQALVHASGVRRALPANSSDAAADAALAALARVDPPEDLSRRWGWSKDSPTVERYTAPRFWAYSEEAVEKVLELLEKAGPSGMLVSEMAAAMCCSVTELVEVHLFVASRSAFALILPEPGTDDQRVFPTQHTFNFAWVRCDSTYAQAPDGDQRCLFGVTHKSRHINRAGQSWTNDEADAETEQ